LFKILEVGGDEIDAAVIGIFPTRRRDADYAFLRDVDLVKTRLGLSGGLALAAEATSLEEACRIFFGTFFRTPLFRLDLYDFLRDGRERLQQLRPAWASEASVRGWTNEAWFDVVSARRGNDGHVVLDDLPEPVRQDPRLVEGLDAALRRRDGVPSTEPLPFRAFEDPALLQELGRPENFRDHVHMNAGGAARFTDAFAAFLSPGLTAARRDS
jgi:hypothetical protein